MGRSHTFSFNLSLSMVSARDVFTMCFQALPPTCISQRYCFVLYALVSRPPHAASPDSNNGFSSPRCANSLIYAFETPNLRSNLNARDEMTGRRSKSRPVGQAGTRANANSHQELKEYIAWRPEYEEQYAQQLEEANEARKRAERLKSMEDNLAIENLLSPAPQRPYDVPRKPKREVATLPPNFKKKIIRAYHQGQISEPVLLYYLNLHHADSDKVPGQGGRVSLLQAVLYNDAQMIKDSGWRAKRSLGQGQFGDVVLWEKRRADGLPVNFYGTLWRINANSGAASQSSDERQQH